MRSTGVSGTVTRHPTSQKGVVARFLGGLCRALSPCVRLALGGLGLLVLLAGVAGCLEWAICLGVVHAGNLVLLAVRVLHGVFSTRDGTGP
jgi:hypothetical protein